MHFTLVCPILNSQSIWTPFGLLTFLSSHCFLRKQRKLQCVCVCVQANVRARVHAQKLQHWVLLQLHDSWPFFFFADMFQRSVSTRHPSGFPCYCDSSTLLCFASSFKTINRVHVLKGSADGILLKSPAGQSPIAPLQATVAAERGRSFPAEEPASCLWERNMNVSLARESLGTGPRATMLYAGRYKVGATADVLDISVATVPNSTSRRPCQTCPGNWQSQLTRERREDGCELDTEAKESEKLNQQF